MNCKQVALLYLQYFSKDLFSLRETWNTHVFLWQLFPLSQRNKSVMWNCFLGFVEIEVITKMWLYRTENRNCSSPVIPVSKAKGSYMLVPSTDETAACVFPLPPPQNTAGNRKSGPGDQDPQILHWKMCHFQSARVQCCVSAEDRSAWVVPTNPSQSWFYTLIT